MSEFIKRNKKEFIKHLLFQDIIYKNLQFQFEHSYYQIKSIDNQFIE